MVVELILNKAGLYRCHEHLNLATLPRVLSICYHFPLVVSELIASYDGTCRSTIPLSLVNEPQRALTAVDSGAVEDEGDDDIQERSKKRLKVQKK